MNKIITILLILSLNALATSQDASRIQRDTTFAPSTNNKATRALIKAEAVEGTANTALENALEANGIAQGTRETLINPEGCIYNSNFDCNEENLTYKFETQSFSQSWSLVGTHYFQVPEGVSSINVTLRGGNGKRVVSEEGSYNFCGDGGSVTFGSLSASGGKKYGQLLYCSMSSPQTITETISVSSQQSFKMVINSAPWVGNNYNGYTGSVTVDYISNLRVD